MGRNALNRGVALAIVLGLLAAPLAWSAPASDTGAVSWTVGWIDRLGGWLAEVMSRIGSSEDRGAGIDQDVLGTGAPETGGTCHDCGPEIDPDG